MIICVDPIKEKIMRQQVFLSLLSCLCLTSAQVTRSCREYTTCGQCMEAGPHCGWCSQEEFKVLERCDVKDNLLKNGCDPTYIESAPSAISYNKKIPPKNADKNTEAVQLSPQEISIKLRPNGPFQFPVQFRLAEDYPVDLYYIMDLSDSMKDDKDKLAQLGDLLAEQMNNITKNFRLGFGSFVDKKTMPYVSIKPDDLKEPCNQCTSPYGFRNQLPLTLNTAQFKNKVNETQISGNLDSPEGGFDAIMQSVVCHDEIGWRNQSRKMLLFSTDAGFHHAGDGKLGGIVVPNDMTCHLDESGEYTKSLEQDYPSISQLAMKIAENKVNVIFAVVADQKHVYGNLSTFIEGSTVGVLDDDSSNIVQLVKDNYDKISSNVEMRTEQDEDFTVSFSTKCLGSETKGNRCDNIKIGNSITFDVTVSATSCPKNRENWKKTFYIYPVGLSEKLKVNVELICECGCEANGSKEISSKCNNQGTYQCGACMCFEGMSGRTCECDGTKAPDGDLEGTCKQGEASKVCSGHGQCVCGTCECGPINPFEPSKRYSGPFCECNNYNCDYEDGMLCGGPERGICNCSKCVCNKGFDGSGCGCSLSNHTCLAKDGSICNNKGRCDCGKCTCTELSYKGKTCEECPTCPSACDERRSCVLCGAFKNYNKLSAEKCSEDCPMVALIDDLDSLNDTLWNACKFRDESDDCDIIFKWHQTTNEIKVQKTKVCPTPVNILAIVLSVIGGIIFIGLLLLILGKILVTIHDRREFARFEKERENAKWDMGENPIYKQATSTYKNPTYNKS